MIVYHSVITQDRAGLNPSATFKTFSERSENDGYCVLLNCTRFLWSALVSILSVSWEDERMAGMTWCGLVFNLEHFLWPICAWKWRSFYSLVGLLVIKMSLLLGGISVVLPNAFDRWKCRISVLKFWGWNTCACLKWCKFSRRPFYILCLTHFDWCLHFVQHILPSEVNGNVDKGLSCTKE